MRQQSSLTQSAHSVRQVLTAYTVFASAAAVWAWAGLSSRIYRAAIPAVGGHCARGARAACRCDHGVHEGRPGFSALGPPGEQVASPHFFPRNPPPPPPPPPP